MLRNLVKYKSRYEREGLLRMKERKQYQDTRRVPSQGEACLFFVQKLACAVKVRYNKSQGN